MSDALKRDLEACEAATGGPWDIATAESLSAGAVFSQGPVYTSGGMDGFEQAEHDALFIARSRTRWPAALRVVQAVLRMEDRMPTLQLPEDLLEALRAFKQDDHA